MDNDYERLHAALKDEELDAIARIAGLPSGIGRLSYLDDLSLEALAREMGIRDGTRVLDLGCGRGFLGRWLRANRYSVDYTAMDVSASALDAVRRRAPRATCVRGDLREASGGPYDVVFAVESIWSVDGEMAAKIRSLLEIGGRFVITFASLGEGHDGRVTTSLASLDAAGFKARKFPLPADHTKTVGRLCASTTLDPPTDPWVRERLVAEAYATLAALRDQEFRYDIVVAKRAG